MADVYPAVRALGMNVGFIGAPCSGKTTTAALLFAQLKDDGVVAEFVAERARYYIARKKYAQDVHGPLLEEDVEGRVLLTDQDQFQIMQEQYEIQHILHHVVGESGVVVSDASAIGALSYMSEKGRKSEVAQRWIQAANEDTDLLFFAHPINGYDLLDPNRIHTFEEARVIHNEIPDLLTRFSPAVPLIELRGDSLARKNAALRAVYERLST